MNQDSKKGLLSLLVFFPPSLVFFFACLMVTTGPRIHIVLYGPLESFILCDAPITPEIFEHLPFSGTRGPGPPHAVPTRPVSHVPQVLGMGTGFRTQGLAVRVPLP